MKNLIIVLSTLLLLSFAPHKNTKGIFDLQVDLTKEINDVYMVGEKLTFDFSVQNVGTSLADDKAYRIDLYINGKKTLIDKVGSKLNPEQKVKYSMKKGKYHVSLDKLGTYTYKIILTANKGYVDVDLRNNIVSGEFEVTKRRASRI